VAVVNTSSEGPLTFIALLSGHQPTTLFTRNPIGKAKKKKGCFSPKLSALTWRNVLPKMTIKSSLVGYWW
jgi:hypothetical protein